MKVDDNTLHKVLAQVITLSYTDVDEAEQIVAQLVFGPKWNISPDRIGDLFLGELRQAFVASPLGKRAFATVRHD